MTCPLCQKPDLARLMPIDGRDAALVECVACGKYQLDAMAPAAIEHGFAGRAFLLSAAARAASDAGRPALVAPETLEELAASVTRPNTLLELVDRLVLFLAARAPDFWSAGSYHIGRDFPVMVLKNEQEWTYLFKVAADMGLLQVGTGILSPQGWAKADELRRSSPHSRQAFVAMWFDEQLTDAWLNGFRAGIVDTGAFEAMRIDGVQHNGKIDDRIVAEIRRSGLVVADFTGNRGGVYFEAGLASGLGIPVIWTCRQDCIADVHFDTRQYNHIVWSAPGQLRSALRDRILATIVARAV